MTNAEPSGPPPPAVPAELTGPTGSTGSTPAAEEGAQRGPTLGYLPSLDGLRGLAAIGVVLFHAQLDWMRGGFLAVTTFFALSGFLLTSLLVAEHHHLGAVDARTFWGRRFRRLLPAALVTLGAVSALAPWLATPEQLASLRGDVVAALLYVANWRFVLEGRAYTDLFSDPSPVQHFWTLSVEEQIFLVLPLLLLGVIAAAGRRLPTTADGAARTAALQRVLVPTLAGLVLASATWLWLTYDAADDGLRAYYSTFTRASEFLIGGLAAVALGRPRTLGAPAARRALQVAGPLGLVALVALWSVTEDGSAWLYHGGFPLVAALSTLVLVACLQGGPLSVALGAAPLREVGRRSYGIYLFHWPVLLWLTADRVGLDGYPLLAVQLALVGAMAWVSFAWLEQPIRLRRRLTSRRSMALVPLGMAAVAGLAVVATIDPPRSELVFERQADPTVPTAGAGDDRPVTLVVGDSMANNLAAGLARTATDDLALYDRTTPGCGLAESERRVEEGDWKPPDPDCAPGWRERWAAELAEIDPDVVVLQVGTQEVWDRRIEGTEIRFDDDAGRALATAEVTEAVELLSSQGAEVVLVTLPASEWTTWGLRLADADRSVNNPEWVARWNEVLRDVAATHPETVSVADLAAVLTPDGTYESELDGVTVRAGDGLHLTAAGQDLAATWLVPIVDAAAER